MWTSPPPLFLLLWLGGAAGGGGGGGPGREQCLQPTSPLPSPPLSGSCVPKAASSPHPPCPETLSTHRPTPPRSPQESGWYRHRKVLLPGPSNMQAGSPPSPSSLSWYYKRNGGRGGEGEETAAAVESALPLPLMAEKAEGKERERDVGMSSWEGLRGGGERGRAVKARVK